MLSGKRFLFLWTLLMFQVSLHLYSCMLFPVWCSALVHTDCQSNALTPFICSMVTSLMDVMSWVAASIKCYLLCGHSTQATVRSSVYTWIITCYNIHAYNIHTLIFMYQLLLYLCSFKCTYCYSFMTNCYVSLWISTLNALANLFWHIHVFVDCSWTCSLYTTLLNPLWYWYCKFSIYEPLLQWICWTQHTYLIKIRLDIIWLEILKENMSTWEGIDMRKAILM